jgi:hypothetical protein
MNAVRQNVERSTERKVRESLLARIRRVSDGGSDSGPRAESAARYTLPICTDTTPVWS